MVFVFGSVYVVNYVFFSFLLLSFFLLVVNYVYRLVYVESALHLQDEAHLIMMDKLFDVLLPSVCQYFI